MPPIALPNEPNLEQLRRQAKDLRDAVRRGEPDALALVAEHHPKGEPDSRSRPTFALNSAQLVVARRYGFASWPRLKQHLEVVAQFMRTPGRASAPGSLADEFMRHACLNYADDGPERWQRARQIANEHREIADHSIHAATAANDVEAVRRHLQHDPLLARADGGPFAWRPLLYLAYSRVDPSVPAERVIAIATMLLDAGADPNDGYLWHGLPSPFTVLTGAFGEGELGPRSQPRHPRSIELARLLLEAGADPNDAQTLYNRMFEPDDSHLELLFEFGLGRGDGGPWKRRLGEALETPTQMLRGQLRWAVSHGMVERTRLLLDRGVDPSGPFHDGQSPSTAAALSGHLAIVALLEARGGQAPQLDGPDALIAAALAGDRATVERVRAEQPDALDIARGRRPGLVVWTAAQAPDSVALVVELGFDVNALGRSDTPREQEWETALHEAAGIGDAALARQLLALGADPSIRDKRFDSTPLGWARHFGHQDVIDLLMPLTPPDP